MALRVDGARWAGDATAPDLALAGRLPWIGGVVSVAAAPAALSTPAGKAGLALLRIRDGAEEIAVRIDRLERVERPGWSAPLDGSSDSLLRVDDGLLTARGLGPGRPEKAAYALILRGDRPGERAALLVERALGVERCPCDRLVPVRHSDGGGSLWWRIDEGAPRRVIDPGPLFGWAACPDEGRAAADAQRSALGAARPDCLVVEIGGHAVALPLALVGQIDESEMIGGAVPVRLAGMRRALWADRVRPLEAGADDWRRLAALPPAAALLFDAARWDAAAARWLFRVNADSLTQLQGKGVAWSLKRTLALARRAWGDGPDARRRAASTLESNLPVTASP